MHELGVQIGEKVAKSEALGKNCITAPMQWYFIQCGIILLGHQSLGLACVFSNDILYYESNF